MLGLGVPRAWAALGAISAAHQGWQGTRGLRRNSTNLVFPNFMRHDRDSTRNCSGKGSVCCWSDGIAADNRGWRRAVASLSFGRGQRKSEMRSPMSQKY